MLTLRLHSGDYIAIGDQIFVQVYRTQGEGVAVAVEAPRELYVTRGERYELTAATPESIRHRWAAHPPRLKSMDRVKQAIPQFDLQQPDAAKRAKDK